jgi:serine/threonine protein kinase
VLAADTEADTPWCASQYVDGPTLGQAVTTGGSLGGDRLTALAVALADALGTVHRAGVVHRDLKPSNILLTPATPVVIDFGIASALDGTSLTGTGVVLGSAGWMAPEQVTGGATGPWSDVFAWGAVVAFAATGVPPFGEGHPNAVTYRVVHDAPNLGPIGAPLAELVSTALAKEPMARPTTDDVIRTLVGDSTISNAPPSAAPTLIAQKWHWEPPAGAPSSGRPRGRRRAVTAGVVSCVLVTGAVVVSQVLDNDESRRTSDAPTSTTGSASTTVATVTAPATTAASTTTSAPPATTAPPTTHPAAPTEYQFDPVGQECTPDRQPEIDREWQVSVSPLPQFPGDTSYRTEIYPADRVELGLRNKFGWDPANELNVPLTVSIVSPTGRVDQLNTFLQFDQWSSVTYPSDAFDMASGTHTIVWESEGQFIVCWGFEVEQLRASSGRGSLDHSARGRAGTATYAGPRSRWRLQAKPHMPGPRSRWTRTERLLPLDPPATHSSTESDRAASERRTQYPFAAESRDVVFDDHHINRGLLF